MLFYNQLVSFISAVCWMGDGACNHWMLRSERLWVTAASIDIRLQSKEAFNICSPVKWCLSCSGADCQGTNCCSRMDFCVESVTWPTIRCWHDILRSSNGKLLVSTKTHWQQHASCYTWECNLKFIKNVVSPDLLLCHWWWWFSICFSQNAIYL